MNHAELVNRYFKEPDRDRSSGNVYARDGALYSYGPHFPLAVRVKGGWLLNGDRYSVTTSHHQSMARSAAHRHVEGTSEKACIIPLSALGQALGSGKLFEEIEILGVTADEYREVKYKDPETGEEKIRQEHLLGSTLFRHGKNYFLSSTDPTGYWGRNYFLTKLVRRVKTVAAAYDSLMPKAVKAALAAGLDIKRQGEYFFVPVKDAGPVWKRNIKKRVPIKSRYDQAREHAHVPLETTVARGRTLVRGTVRHRGAPFRTYAEPDVVRYVRGDHKMLKLGMVWHTVHENVQAGSWGTDGKVD